MSDIKISKDKNGNCYGPQLVTPVGRIMYVNLAEGKANQFGKYTANLLIEKTPENRSLVAPRTDEEVAAGKAPTILDIAYAALVELYGSEANIPEELPSMPVMDGDESDANGNIAEATRGCWVIRLASNDPLTSGTCVDAACKEYDPLKLVAGMLCRAVISPMAFVYSKQSFGVKWQLAQLQFVKDDGVRLRGSVPQGTLLTPIDFGQVPTAGLSAVADAPKKSGLRALA